jgi:chlorobactene glucosyltransferase
MMGPLHIWAALAAIVGALWLVRHWAINYVMKRRRVLSSADYPLIEQDAPKVSVLVAAKDEEENIEACLKSLLNQAYPSFEIIAINDRSTDQTLPLLRELEKQARGRLRIVNIDSLPDGWFGKNNAMWQGARLATGEYLCMIDADCRQTSSKMLSTAVQHARAYHTDLLSIFPRLESRTWWERLLQPVCAGLLFAWFPTNKVNKRRKNVAYANGQFMLMRRSAYDQIGGHQRVRTQVNEDIHLARLIKEHNLRLRVVENADLTVARMYHGFGELFHGWSRIFYGALGSVPKLVVSISSIVFLTLLPWISVVAAWIGCVAAPAGRKGPWIAAACGWGAVVILVQVAALRLYRVFRVRWWYSLGYVLAATVLLGILCNAVLKVLGLSVTTWRGTTYLGGRVVASAEGTPSNR